jgi:hypothetical protein
VNVYALVLSVSGNARSSRCLIVEVVEMVEMRVEEKLEFCVLTGD